MERQNGSWIIPALLAIAVAGGAWYYWNYLVNKEDARPLVSAPAEQPESAYSAGPSYPMANPDMSVSEMPELRELPELGNSDEYFKLELTDLFGLPIGDLIATERLVERVVATVDNLPRGHVAERMRPVGALNGAFETRTEASNQISIAYESYRRYDPLVAIVVETNVDDLVGVYRRYYPLFQKSYANLGYPDGYFNDRLVEAIDDMLATPTPAEPVMLIRPHVLYEFADPDLESRSAGQKLVLRMGPDNAAKVKERLQQLRVAITSQ
jgi:hypothetical protein